MFDLDNFLTRWSNYIPSRRYNDPYGEDVIVLASEDLILQDTIGEANCDSIADDLHDLATDDRRAWVREVFVRISDIEDEETAERVEEILESLENYPIWNEYHYHDLENQRLQEYVEEHLSSDLAYELGIDDSDELFQWIKDNIDVIWENNDGSVDDAPFNVKGIAAEYLHQQESLI